MEYVKFQMEHVKFQMEHVKFQMVYLQLVILMTPPNLTHIKLMESRQKLLSLPLTI